MTTVSLGLPEVPPPALAERRQSRQINVGAVPVGGGAPVSVQSMTTTVTADVNSTLQQIAELTAAGCQIVRVAVPSADDAEALPAIAKKSQIPVSADIHFQPRCNRKRFLGPCYPFSYRSPRSSLTPSPVRITT